MRRTHLNICGRMRKLLAVAKRAKYALKLTRTACGAPRSRAGSGEISILAGGEFGRDENDLDS